MSQIFTLKGNSHVISVDFINPIQLDHNSDYALALTSFHSYNSIPNIDLGANKFYYYSEDSKERKEITIPTGAYEILDIETYLRKQIIPKTIKEELHNQYLSLKPNNNTLKCDVSSDFYEIDFQPSDSIGKLLGFSKRILSSKKLHESDLPVNIIKVRTIQINCNITTGSFYNQRPSHTIYEFAVGVEPGFAIDERPQNLIYLPIINKREISNITLTILNQNFEPINFRGEDIIIGLEFKKIVQ